MNNSAPFNVPKGWKLVPIVPTDEMVQEGSDSNPTCWNETTDNGFPLEVAKYVYAAMLASAPAAAILQAATRDDLGDTDAENAARYLQLRKHAGQIGSMLWRHAPWTHESLEENQARLDLCLDEERVEAIAASAPKGDGND